ncbi:hypothetical protein Amal_00699 [Acetobacter malorum]|uniref:Uncharacterized protein n=1 Tax=Acetobacter malorum TaxID=178901 RepID=A0A177GCW8_9PROT|nr:hypothetical protein Amal_00699 [Acetobacter malorum]
MGKGSYTHGLYETILMTKVPHDQTFTYWHCRAQSQHSGLCQRIKKKLLKALAKTQSLLIKTHSTAG